MQLEQSEDDVAKLLGFEISGVLGCGSFGIVYNLKRERNKVLKISSDFLEVEAVDLIMKLRNNGEEEAVHFAPIYYQIHKINQNTTAYVREKVAQPVHCSDITDKDLMYLNRVAGGFFDALKKLDNRWCRLVEAFKRMNEVHKFSLQDIRRDNIGKTIGDNQYRKNGDLVIFDFQNL